MGKHGSDLNCWDGMVHDKMGHYSEARDHPILRNKALVCALVQVYCHFHQLKCVGASVKSFAVFGYIIIATIHKKLVKPSKPVIGVMH